MAQNGNFSAEVNERVRIELGSVGVAFECCRSKKILLKFEIVIQLQKKKY